MNIANVSLDSVGEKAQGINRVVISIVNQQEDREKRKEGGECERICMSKTERKCRLHLILSEASSTPFSSGHVI